MTRDQRAKYNHYINRSFRDVADSDYVAARAIYRLGLSQQFLWMALQAIEKYLKAILLYNDVNTKNLGHDIAKACADLNQISDITFDIPKDVEDFIRYLSSQGENRYFERPFYTRGSELLELDRAVWYVRRYCQVLRSSVKMADGKSVDFFPLKLAEIHNSETKENPAKFKILGGHLEKLLRKPSRTRDAIIWKNFYFGTYRKRTITNFKWTSSSAIPANFNFPEIFLELDSKIKFSPAVKAYFQKLLHRPEG